MDSEAEESQFEQDRIKRIRRNQEELDAIGVRSSVEKLANKLPCGGKQDERERPTAGRGQCVRRSCRLGARETSHRIRAMDRELHCSTESEGSELFNESRESESLGESGGSETQSSDSDKNAREHVQNVAKIKPSKQREGCSAHLEDITFPKKKGTGDRFQSWPDADDEEARRAYLMFAKEGGGLMTVESVVKVASKLSVHLDEDQVSAMVGYATSKTSCHPRCLTLSEFRLLIKALTQPNT